MAILAMLEHGQDARGTSLVGASGAGPGRTLFGPTPRPHGRRVAPGLSPAPPLDSHRLQLRRTNAIGAGLKPGATLPTYRPRHCQRIDRDTANVSTATPACHRHRVARLDCSLPPCPIRLPGVRPVDRAPHHALGPAKAEERFKIPHSRFKISTAGRKNTSFTIPDQSGKI